MLSFKVLNTTVQVSFSFTVFITLLAIFDKTGLLFISFLAIILHEIGHIIAIKILGINEFSIRFVLGSIRVELKQYLSNTTSCVISLCGPLFNLVLSLFMFFNNYYLLYFGASNLIVFAFNMLPINGLDGGDVLKCALNRFFKKSSEKIFAKISLIFTITFTAICGSFFSIKYFNPTLLIVGIYLIIMSIKKV